MALDLYRQPPFPKQPVSIIATRFIIDQHPFFFEALAQVNNNTFIFQQHLKATFDLLLPLSRHVFLLLDNSLRIKWSNFRIPLWSVYTIITFLTCFPTWYLKLIMFKFYYVLILWWVFGLCASFSHVQPILLMNQHCVHQRWPSHLS
jgi:hypothetical protein